tara:strand:+ start:179 stop:610 length:432 start_codon:yes stop_codon:yes gene_type:complete
MVNMPAGRNGIANFRTVLKVNEWIDLKLIRCIIIGNVETNRIPDAKRFDKRTPQTPYFRKTTKMILNAIVERTLIKLKIMKGIGFSSARKSNTGKFHSTSNSITTDRIAIHSGLSSPRTVFAIMFLDKKKTKENRTLVITWKP